MFIEKIITIEIIRVFTTFFLIQSVRFKKPSTLPSPKIIHMPKHIVEYKGKSRMLPTSGSPNPAKWELPAISKGPGLVIHAGSQRPRICPFRSLSLMPATLSIVFKLLVLKTSILSQSCATMN